MGVRENDTLRPILFLPRVRQFRDASRAEFRLDAQDAITIQLSIDKLMNAKDNEIDSIANEGMGLIEHLNQVPDRRVVDLSGIVPDEDETDATTVIWRYPE